MSASDTKFYGYACAINDLIQALEAMRDRRSLNTGYISPPKDQAAAVIDLIEEWKVRLATFQNWLIEATEFQCERRKAEVGPDATNSDE
jgi:hypothetical protein